MEAKQFEFTDHDFHQFRDLVTRHTGIYLADNKRELVYGRLSRRLRALGLNKFSAYRKVLEQGDPAELQEFANLITTNLTSFFRESHHFDYLKQTLLPELMRAKQAEKKIRIWSAGCSSGEEPYSIAMVVREVIHDLNSWDVKILATDLDSNMLDIGRNGVYDSERITGISQERVKRFLFKGKGAHQGKVKTVPDIQNLISFKKLNLMENWPMQGKFDIIFCRNVVIYFDKETQTRLFSRFADALNNDGRLFVGHSETLNKVTNRFELMSKTVYKLSKLQ